ncbi:hypothetical protein OSTOST_18798 [Ostertagia ostertagi]
MSQPEQPVFPQDAPQMDIAVVEKHALPLITPYCYLEMTKKAKIELDLEALGLTSQEFEPLLAFFTDLWRYLIYHRLGGQSLSNVLKSSLPLPYIDLVAAIWYSDGPSVYTHLARRTASDKARVQDISWSIWTQTASDYALDKSGQHGIRLNIVTDKGTKSVFLTPSQVANLHKETVRIQTEIDKLLE